MIEMLTVTVFQANQTSPKTHLSTVGFRSALCVILVVILMHIMISVRCRAVPISFHCLPNPRTCIWWYTSV